MTRISAKWSVVFIGVIAILSLSFAAYAAGDSGKEISTAAQHAGLAAKATTIDMVHTHPFVSEGGPDIRFDLTFARARTYRVWVQFQRNGVVNTAHFDIPVTE